MYDLYRMMMEAQNGEAMKNMAKQFGISPEQAEAAMRATLPAFSLGLKQNTADPAGLQAFMQALSGGHHARYFEDLAAIFDPKTRDDGNAILGHLFGSKDVSRIVAEQAAQASGIGAAIIKQMLPLIASMIMGGFFRQAQSSEFQDMVSEFIRQMTGTAAERAPESRSEPQRQQPDDAPSSGSPNDPFGDIFRDILGGMFGGAPTEHTPPRSESRETGRTSGRSAIPGMPELPQTGADFFGSMFESGLEASNKMQREQARAMEQMMETLFKTKGR